MVDMTRERRLEQDLQRPQRLELVGRLSSGIAHDFNNLLTVVLSLTDLARGQLPEDHPAHDDLRRIAEAGEQAANLAGAAARLQQAAARRPPSASTSTAWPGARWTCCAAPCRRRSQVEATWPTASCRCEADETQLQQVLMNLCLNARDAMPGGGRLRVRTEVVDGRAAGAGDDPWVRLSVAGRRRRA